MLLSETHFEYSSKIFWNCSIFPISAEFSFIELNSEDFVESFLNSSLVDKK